MGGQFLYTNLRTISRSVAAYHHDPQVIAPVLRDYAVPETSFRAPYVAVSRELYQIRHSYLDFDRQSPHPAVGR